MAGVGETGLSEVSEHDVGLGEVGHTLRQVAIGGAVGEKTSDLRNDLAEVEAVADTDEATLRNSDVEQSDSPTGANDPSELAEKDRKVDEIAQGEPARRAIDRSIGERKSKDIGLRPRRTRTIGGQHAETEVERQGLETGPTEIDAEVTGSARQIDDPTSARQSEFGHRLLAPTNVETERHDAVDHVVARGDGIEHAAYRRDLLVAGRQLSGVPGTILRHGVRLWGHVSRCPLGSPTGVTAGQNGGGSAPVGLWGDSAMIDFTLAPEHEEIRRRVRDFVDGHIRPAIEPFGHREEMDADAHRAYVGELIRLRKLAVSEGLWLPHMPKEWGGMGLGHVALAMVQAEAARTRVGPWVLNCQAPDEGNMHTLVHWGTDEQKQKYLKPLCDGVSSSCFAMTEPEVAGSDPTLIRTHAIKDGDEWIINGHKWFISGANRAKFAILIARTEMDVPEGSRGANTAFIIDLPAEGWNNVREVETMHGPGGHSEIVIEDLRVHDSQILGGRGNGHRLGQYRLGPARLAHCMRWIAQAETALDMMVDRSLKRYSHGSYLAEKQGVQWMIADSAMELYQCKLMVLHAAYKIDRGDDFRTEVSMAKHFVANSLNRIIDRAIQVHGALGYSTDTPLANMLQHARWARFADGADEIHQMRIAENTIKSFTDTGSTRLATGDLPV